MHAFEEFMDWVSEMESWLFGAADKLCVCALGAIKSARASLKEFEIWRVGLRKRRYRSFLALNAVIAYVLVVLVLCLLFSIF